MELVEFGVAALLSVDQILQIPSILLSRFSFENNLTIEIRKCWCFYGLVIGYKPMTNRGHTYFGSQSSLNLESIKSVAYRFEKPI